MRYVPHMITYPLMSGQMKSPQIISVLTINHGMRFNDDLHYFMPTHKLRWYGRGIRSREVSCGRGSLLQQAGGMERWMDDGAGGSRWAQAVRARAAARGQAVRGRPMGVRGHPYRRSTGRVWVGCGGGGSEVGGVGRDAPTRVRVWWRAGKQRHTWSAGWSGSSPVDACAVSGLLHIYHV